MRKFSLNLLSLLGFTFLVLSQNSFAADIENGEKIFTANCSACHAGGNNVIMPEKTLKKDVLEANGMKSVDAITYQVTNGKNAMPKWAGVLSDGDIAAVITYTRNSWSNKTGEVIQTQEIITARGGK